MPNNPETGLSDDLARKLEEIDNLPSLPELLVRLLDLCESENVEIRSLARLIETDPALSAKIVGIVNSLAYGLPNRLTGLESCVIHLGTDATRSIALCAAVAGVLQADHRSGRATAELRRVTRHSLVCALLARELARAMGLRNPDEAFLAGLVHDVGKHVLLSLYPEAYVAALERGRSNPDQLLAEEMRLGGLHSAVGAWLMRRWRLPGEVADALAWHHEPRYRVMDASALVRLVHGANFLAEAEGAADGATDERAAELLALTPAAVIAARSTAAKALAETARGLGLDLVGAEPAPAVLEERQGRLEREVRSVSMLLASLWDVTRAPDERGVLTVVFRALAGLFRLDQALYFSHHYERGTLVCRHSSRPVPPDTLEGLVVNRASSSSLVAEASRTHSIRYHAGPDAPPVILDRQIGGLLGGHPYALYPLSARGEPVGVLVVSSPNGSLDCLRRRERPLGLLAAEAALALQADRHRERELARVRSERIAASQLAADRVAHEIRSPLAAIRTTVGALLQMPETPPACGEPLRTIGEEADRVGRLLGGLSRLGAAPPPVSTEVDLPALVEGFLPVLTRLEVPRNVTVTQRIARPLPLVRANADSLKQILINLVRNAAEAMPGGGVVVVTVERDPVEGSGGCRIVVEDQGPGLPGRIAGRLFEPFVTTKSEPHRGLGLAIVHTLARQMDAVVRYEPAAASQGGGGAGARFVVSLGRSGAETPGGSGAAGRNESGPEARHA